LLLIDQYLLEYLLLFSRNCQEGCRDRFPGGQRQKTAGDSPELVANSTIIKNVLKWTPKYDDIEYVVRTAREWERKLK